MSTTTQTLARLRLQGKALGQRAYLLAASLDDKLLTEETRQRAQVQLALVERQQADNAAAIARLKQQARQARLF